MFIYGCVAGHVYAYLMQYYSTIKKNKILSFVITQMDLEGIILHEIYQRKTDTMWSHIWNLKNKEIKQKQGSNYREKILVARREGSRMRVKWLTEIKGYKLLKCHGYIMYSIVTVAYTTVLHISKLLRVNQMSSSQKEKKTCFWLYLVTDCSEIYCDDNFTMYTHWKIMVNT